MRRLFALIEPRRRTVVVVLVALVLLPSLVAVAAAQPVVVRLQSVSERSDVQLFFVLDTTRSMSARQSPGSPTRLDRAIRDVETLMPQLGDIPVGIAAMTDRVLPYVMPTTNDALVLRTLQTSVGIDQPPPSQLYHGRVPTLQSLLSITNAHLFNPGAEHQILVVFTDGESPPATGFVANTLARAMTAHPLLVHMSLPGERVYAHGRLDPGYVPDPASGRVLSDFAALTRGQVFGEQSLGALLRTIRAEAGNTPVKAAVAGYRRLALAPWFVLAGVVPLGFLLYRRNL